MSADDAIEINFPSLARSAPDEKLEEIEESDVAPLEESNDFAWLAAAFADDDLEDDELRPEEVTADPTPSEGASTGESIGEVAPWPDTADGEQSNAQDAAATEPLSRPSVTPLDAPGDPLGSVPPLMAAVPSADSEVEDPSEGLPSAEPAPTGAETQDDAAILSRLRNDAITAAGTDGKVQRGSADRPEDATSRTIPDPTSADDATPDSAAFDDDEPEESITSEDPTAGNIDSLRRRPGFREELLSAFSQIYKR